MRVGLLIILAMALMNVPAGGEALRLALVSDPHVGSDPAQAAYLEHFQRVIEQVNAAGVDAVLLAGDLTDHGDADSLERFTGLARRFHAPAWSVAGNHDVGNKRKEGSRGGITAGRLATFERVIGPSFFAADIASGVRVLGINASLPGSGLERDAEQWAFLERELIAAGDPAAPRTTLLLTHYPLFVQAPDEADDYFNFAPEPRARLLELLKRGGVRAVLSGHLHRPLSREIDGIRFIGAPAVSFGLPRDRQAVGWTLVTIHADGRIEAAVQELPPAPRQAEMLQATAPTAPGAPIAPGAGRMAVLPRPDEANYVFEYFRKRGEAERLHALTGEQVIDPAQFNPANYPVCLYLSGEQYLRSVSRPADVERALRDYTAAGGILLVLSSGPYPFYMDETGAEVIGGLRLGLVFLGNEEAEGDVVGFDDPPVKAGLRFAVDPRYAANGLPAELAFPAEGDRRWRPLVQTGHDYERWIILRDAEGRHLGDAAGWIARGSGERRGAVGYVSYLLTQRHPQRDRVLDAVFDQLAARMARATTQPAAAVSDRVHIFYYNWFGAPPHQEGFVHWQQGGHTPPDDIGANYYPKLGAYSSSDPRALRQHMAWMRQSGAGVLSLTWWGQGSYEDRHALAVMDAAAEAGLKVNFHLEPYGGMTPESLERDVRYILQRYGGHPAFYRAADLGNRPMFYVFETLRHSAAAWRPVTDRLARSAEPVLLIAQTTDLDFIVAAGFDGGYPYDVLTPFKTDRFLREWTDRLGRQFAEAGKLFIPSVGPGYWDDRAVPRGADEPPAARTRDHGRSTTYEAMWRAAIDSGAPFVTITSFNEWHEGSQIEPAVAKTIDGYAYPPYAHGELHYIELTSQWVQRFVQARRSPARAAQ